MLVESYSVTMRPDGGNADGGIRLRPLVRCYGPSGEIVWQGNSFHVAHRFHMATQALGSPPWIPPLEVEIHLSHIRHGVNCYGITITDAVAGHASG